MRLTISMVSLAALAMYLGACEYGPVPSSKLPSHQEKLKRKAKAELDMQKGYYKGQVQIHLEDQEGVSAFVSDMASKHSLNLALLDEIPGRALYLFEFHSSYEMDEVLSRVSKDERVLGAAPNYRIEVQSREGFQTNDPHRSLQWALENKGQEAPRSLSGRPGADIGIQDVEAQGSHDVVVAVLDTGIDYLHEDLAITQDRGGHVEVLPGSNIWMNPDERLSGKDDDNNGYVDDLYGYNFVSNDDGDPRDDHGHGTHVAGVIGALQNNFTGIAGINGKVSLMGLKFLDAMGSGDTFDAQRAIYYLIDLAKRFPQKRFIMNHSWGGGRSTLEGDADDFLLKAFREAANEDILSIAAAGNANSNNRFNPSFPANYSTRISHMLSVAATNNVDHLASFSSYGHDTVQVAAPGVLIQSTVPQALYPDGYAAWSGTSMAAPHVAGQAALIWAENPHMTGLEVKERIMDSVDVLPQLKGYVSTSGRINVARSLKQNRVVRVDRDSAFEEIPKRVEGPRGIERAMERVESFKEKGADQIQVCFEEVHLAESVDWLQVYGNDYRVRDLITGRWLNENTKTDEDRELCTAPVPGDTLYVRYYSGGASVKRPSFVTEKIRVKR